MQNKSQLLKGVLEGCILKIVKHKGETYGYEVVTEIRNFGFGKCTEGTIYPLLTRLEKRKSLKSEKKESPFGPQRKYYSLTQQGEEELSEFENTWIEFKYFVDGILKNYKGV
ncbi:PadR family transcriptional regulator [Clostridium gasigenes]|uniref:Transcriptional regulator, PadR family n=1 Tax=Clostridium gasigenes TaxID=94869 RepID=A0A1H0R3A0_9CLOT|nr:PadR family transcriptional regulator [Clostridium gasigenes]MBB6622907.1 PadR family transcriptional regulator [Clostridium gasigenes]MBU3087677.1 PadR family transcriptional regulator [Clostridium gasigenes]MBU3132377.1 PadR family transcriptional regulator [Clostridium gasigenes]MBU3135741.1 PadR family transcriptional regulator [Clostridium gasigenes]NKF06101.1 PadR family transcriptional regulator [Clostridium gasigenes]